MEETTPQFVKRSALHASADYVEWLDSIKQRFAAHQAKAAVKVNAEMLAFYWSLGRDIVEMNVEKTYGKGVMENLSLDLRRIFVGQTGFSVDNLYFMKRWYSFYQSSTENFDRLGQNSEMPELFAQIPWRHHVEIIKKCHGIDEAIFYIRKTAESNWSRAMLQDRLKDNLYYTQGKALTNFKSSLPNPQGKIAQQILKDPYNFNFLTMKKGYEERELEDALVANITHFLLELGNGFAFVGRQMELRMSDGQSYFPDLVFYHIKLKSYIVVELKAVPFKPEFSGKINFYVSAADELLRGDGDNPSIGLIICKSASKTVVEWSMRGIVRPLGVATCQLEEVVERTLLEMERRSTIDSGK